MADPASGDIVIRGASAWQRLPKGSDGQVLSIVSNAPAWAAETGGNGTAANVAEIRDQIQYLMFRDDAGYTNLNGLVYDGFTDQTGINNGASANQTWASGYYAPTGGSSNTTIFSGGVAGASSNYTTHYANQAFDGNSVTYWQASTEPEQTLTYDIGSGNTNTLKSFSFTDSGQFSGGLSPKNFTISSSNNASNWATIYTGSNVVWTVSETKTFNVTNSVAGRYFRVAVTESQCGAGYWPAIAEWNGYAQADFANMTLVSANSTASTSPSSGRISLFINPVDAITINTDLKAYASSNGVAFDEITLGLVANLPSSIKQYTGQANFTGANTNISWKITTHNAKNIQVTGVGLAWF